MSNLPADWAIKAALEAAGLPEDVEGVKHHLSRTHFGRSLTAHARLIEQMQPAPVDRKLLCAREAVARMHPNGRDNIERGEWDGDEIVIGVLSGIGLWEDGFGKEPETTVQKCQ